MKNLRVFLFLLAGSALAHDHVEVGKATQTSTQLAMFGPDVQVAVYVPRGEPFSGYMPVFPGGHHTAELSFTAEVNALWPATNANPRIEIVSVTGPADGSFSFWEANATQPTWSRPVGWSSSQGNVPSFMVVVNGNNHIHGRCFTMDKPGTYTVVFRATDTANKFSTSTTKTITFRAQQPPQLAIVASGSNVQLSFTSRAGFAYDLQVCTNLALGVWTNFPSHEFMPGNGSRANLTLTNGLRASPYSFYRLVEYF
jgi:hypothetical protein